MIQGGLQICWRCRIMKFDPGIPVPMSRLIYEGYEAEKLLKYMCFWRLRMFRNVCTICVWGVMLTREFLQWYPEHEECMIALLIWFRIKNDAFFQSSGYLVCRGLGLKQLSTMLALLIWNTFQIHPLECNDHALKEWNFNKLISLPDRN